ncbi:MAG: hypothetical protein NVS2B15_16860 [Pseudarthrobacter sp.]
MPVEGVREAQGHKRFARARSGCADVNAFGHGPPFAVLVQVQPSLHFPGPAQVNPPRPDALSHNGGFPGTLSHFLQESERALRKNTHYVRERRNGGSPWQQIANMLQPIAKSCFLRYGGTRVDGAVGAVLEQEKQ